MAESRKRAGLLVKLFTVLALPGCADPIYADPKCAPGTCDGDAGADAGAHAGDGDGDGDVGGDGGHMVSRPVVMDGSSEDGDSARPAPDAGP